MEGGYMEYKSVNEIRSEVEKNVGKKVTLKADKGRKRIVTKKGIILDAFPSVFTIKVNNEYDTERTVSYSYSDVLTSTVRLQIKN